MDASGSMLDNDPNCFRFDAMKQFASLLSDEGNMIGGVVFTDHVVHMESLVDANNIPEKERITNVIEEFMVFGDTNIGEALCTALDILVSSGNKELPSIILLISDGKTDLPNSEEDALINAHNKQIEALKRARNNNVSIYTICLNGNDDECITEMRFMSDETHGETIVVDESEDLSDVFFRFYELLFGSYKHEIADIKLPQNGRFKRSFTIPALHIKRLDILMIGNAKEVTLSDPQNKIIIPAILHERSYTDFIINNVKVIRPGDWHITVSGAPGESIKLMLIFNCDLGIRLDFDNKRNAYNTNDPLTIHAYLNYCKSSSDRENVKQSVKSLYSDFKAELIVLDSKKKRELYAIPMNTKDNCFEVTKKLPEGTYRFIVRAISSYLIQDSKLSKPINISDENPTLDEINNTPPQAVSDKTTVFLCVWPDWIPFLASDNRIDLNNFFSDTNNENLEFDITDVYPNSQIIYHKYGVVLSVDSYLFFKTAFRVIATDKYNAVGTTKVYVYNLAIFKSMCIILVCVILCICWYLRHLVISFFGFDKGTIYYKYLKNNVIINSGTKALSGRLYFRDIVLDEDIRQFSTSYIYSINKNHAVVITNRGVKTELNPKKKVRRVKLPNGIDVNLILEQDCMLVIHYISKI